MDNKNENIQEEFISDDNLYFLKIFELLLRNKISISSFTLISTFLSILLTSLLTPIYEGKFQIVVAKNKANNENAESMMNNFLGDSASSNKTEEFILKSPSVLKPVYNYAKSNYEKRGQAINKLSFEKWRNKNLNIAFEKGTNVVTINFKDKDKELILKTLTLISNQYQEYSKREREKFLSNAKQFLSTQKVEYVKKSKLSLKKLNKFSIENGLGDIDGFVSLGQQSRGFNLNKLDSDKMVDLIKSANNNNFSDFLSSNISTNKGESRSSEAGQRFKNQFAILEKYETEYLNASSKLKPNSKYLKDLKVKINNLRETLKRPNEILLKYRELTAEANRDENLLNDIENELVLTELEIAKQKEPWQLISEPTVGGKIFPSKVTFGIFGLISSFIISFLYSIYLEKKSGKIYDFEELKKSINCLFLETIFIKNKTISKKLIKNVIEKYSNEDKSKNKSKIGLINYSNKNSDFFINLFENNKNINILRIEDEEIINNSDFLAFIINKEDLVRVDFLLLNKYIKIYDKKIIGWFYFDTTTVI